MLSLIKHRLKDDKGSALVLVIFVLVVVSMIGVTLLNVTVSNYKLMVSNRDFQSVFYTAEAGVRHKIEDIKTEIINVYESTSNADTFFNQLQSYFSTPTTLNYEDTFGKTPQSDVYITGSRVPGSNTASYRIVSIGTIGNSTREVDAVIDITWIPPTGFNISNDMAIFSNSTITLNGGAYINGTVGTNSSAPNTIRLNGGASINGDIYVGSGAGEDVIDKPHWMTVSSPNYLTEERVLLMPDFPPFPSLTPQPDTKVGSYWVIKNNKLLIDNWQSAGYTLELDQDMYFSEIKLDSNYTLNIDVGNTDRRIVVDHLNLSNGHIKLQGTGKLTLYVTNKISTGSGSTINRTNSTPTQADIDKLNIYYKGTNKLDITGGQEIYGSLFAESADIKLAGGGGFQGHIITGGTDVSVTGGASVVTQVIYAPNADVKLSGGGNIKGSVIAKSLTASGGAYINYESSVDMELPFFPPGGTPSIESLLSIHPIKEN